MLIHYQDTTYPFCGYKFTLLDGNPKRVFELSIIGTPIELTANASISTIQLGSLRDELCTNLDTEVEVFDFGKAYASVVGSCRLHSNN